MYLHFSGNMTFIISFIIIKYNLDSQLILEKWSFTILIHTFEELVDFVKSGTSTVQMLYMRVRICVYVCDCANF